MSSCPWRSTRRALSAAAVLLFLFTLSAHAQLQTGNIFGTVTAQDGAVLPGVTVTLSGIGAPLVTVTDAQGMYRFLNLSPGSYALKAELDGYSPVDRPSVMVNIGRNTDVSFQLRPAVSETITVTGEAPLLDQRNIGTGATVTQRELDQIPTARDPWVILQQVPGVLMDRINVGGNESGNQSLFVSKGATGDQATFSVDGVNTTDMVATGGASSYFDFGAFEEIQITTGGTDPRVQTPGAQVNMVTKRGTNDISGSARYFLTPGSTQGERKVPGEARRYLGNTNEIDDIVEWGVEAGGPVIRDRLWLWGSYGDNDIRLLTAQPPSQATRYADRSSLETINVKLNAQVMRDNSLTLFWYDNKKVKQGRNASPQRPPETTWYQDSNGPTGTYKVEDTHLFSPNFYLTGMYSHVNSGFKLIPDSGSDCRDLDCVYANATKPAVFDVSRGGWRNTFTAVTTQRPQDSYRLDGAHFFNTRGAGHELKFGFGYRTAAGEGTTYWPQNHVIYDFGGTAGFPPGFGFSYFYAISPYQYEFQYQDGYVGDTILWKNLTVQVGLRWDVQKTTAGDQISPGNASVPDYLPALTYRAEDIPEVEWTSIVPRIGLTYAIGEQKTTLLRAAYNRYIGQLGSNSSGYGNIFPGYRYIMFYTYDSNFDDFIDETEVLYDYGIYGFSGFDLNNPSSTLLPNRIDDDITQPNTNEYLLGIERELLTDFVVGLNYTHRDFENFVWSRPEKTRGAGDWYTSADYEVAEVITRPADVTEVPDYSIPVYGLKAGVPVPTYYALTNRDGYSQTYDGVELSVTKRMAKRWMLRGHYTWHDWQQHIGPEAIIDPTRTRSGSGCSNCNDSQVVQGSAGQSGAKGGVWINSKWSTNIAGIYQVPVIETNVGFNFNMREGYPLLYVHQVNLVNGEGIKSVLVNDVGEHRMPNPYSFDLRASKELRYRGVGLEIGVDVFNVTNRQAVLQRNATLVARGARVATANNIREIMNPRVVRVGLRLVF